MMSADQYDDAACREAGPALFYDTENGAEAKKVIRTFCNRCDVEDACLRAALSQRPKDDWGIAGGKTVGQRRKIRRELAAAAKQAAAQQEEKTAA